MNNNRLNQTFSFVKVLLAIVIAMLTAFVIILIVSDEPMEPPRLCQDVYLHAKDGNLTENAVPDLRRPGCMRAGAASAPCPA